MTQRTPDIVVKHPPHGLDAIKNQAGYWVIGSPISVDDPEIGLPQGWWTAMLQRRAPCGPDRGCFHGLYRSPHRMHPCSGRNVDARQRRNLLLPVGPSNGWFYDDKFTGPRIAFEFKAANAGIAGHAGKANRERLKLGMRFRSGDACRGGSDSRRVSGQFASGEEAQGLPGKIAKEQAKKDLIIRPIDPFLDDRAGLQVHERHAMRCRILEAVEPGGPVQAGLVQIGLAGGLYDDG